MNKVKKIVVDNCPTSCSHKSCGEKATYYLELDIGEIIFYLALCDKHAKELDNFENLNVKLRTYK